MDLKKRFFDPTDHPNKINIIADVPGYFMGQVSYQRPGKNYRQEHEPQNNKKKSSFSKKTNQDFVPS